MRSKLFLILIKVAEWCGTVKEANMFTNDFMKITGVTDDGREFYVVLNILDKKEEKKNA